MDTEIWLPIAGYEDLYAVSSLGRVRSLDTILTDKLGRKRIHRGRVLAAPIDTVGYREVCLSRKGHQRTEKVHWLVARTFHGPRVGNAQVRHLNGDPLDNRSENLRWGTQSENMRDRVAHGTDPNASKRECVRGHAYAGSNLVVRRDGHRDCRACTNAAAWARRRGLPITHDSAIAYANEQFRSFQTKEVA